MGTRRSMAIIKDDQHVMVKQIYKGEEIWTFQGEARGEVIEEGETPD